MFVNKDSIIHISSSLVIGFGLQVIESYTGMYFSELGNGLKYHTKGMSLGRFISKRFQSSSIEDQLGNYLNGLYKMNNLMEVSNSINFCLIRSFILSGGRVSPKRKSMYLKRGLIEQDTNDLLYSNKLFKESLQQLNDSLLKLKIFDFSLFEIDHDKYEYLHLLLFTVLSVIYFRIERFKESEPIKKHFMLSDDLFEESRFISSQQIC